MGNDTPLQMASIRGTTLMSIMAAANFIAAFVVAFLSKDQANLGLLIGASIANFTTVVSYWVGSSAGSQKKDEIIAASSPPSIRRDPPAFPKADG